MLLLCGCTHPAAQPGTAPDLTGLSSPAPESLIPPPAPDDQPSTERHLRPEDDDDPADPDQIDI